MKSQFYFVTRITAIAVILFICAFSRQQKDDRPNILLIVSEDHGQHLSCYGDKVIKTPHLDQIAGNGFRFKNAYVTESVCSPSRSTILSGLYPHQTGLLGLTTFGFRYAMPVQTIYARLQAAGYRTGMIGKLHVLPESAFPIGYHPITSPNYERKDMGRYAEYAGQFMNESDDPFFLMVNFPDTHWPFINEIDGLPAAKELPGKSLLPLFKDPSQSFRQYLFTEKNVDQVDLYFPRRAIRDRKYKLIYSLLDTPTNIVAKRYLLAGKNSPLAGSITMKELETASPLVKKIYNAWLTPNKVQLYDLENDPWEFNDLSAYPQYAGVKKRLLDELFRWQKETNDPLRIPEKLNMLTREIDTIKVTKEMQWQYPHYLYGE